MAREKRVKRWAGERDNDSFIYREVNMSKGNVKYYGLRQIRWDLLRWT